MANLEALQQLRRIVEIVPPHRLHMLNFFDKETKCGTAYCPAGWACFDPYFQKRVPELRDAEPDTVPDVDFISVAAGIAVCCNIEPMSAINLFGFGLPEADPHSVTQQEVIDNIDRLIRGEDAKPYGAVCEEEFAANKLYANTFHRYMIAERKCGAKA